MNKLINYLIGPEMLWILFYLIVLIIIKSTNSPVRSMDSFWENMGFIIPLICIPLTFALYFIPVIPHKWLLLRLWIAGIVGSHYVISKSLNAHSEGGPGVGTIYMMGMGIAFLVLIVSTIFVLIKFR